MKKTVKVIDLVAQANAFLLNSPDSDVAGRQAVLSVLESVLHANSSYDGFSYLGAMDMLNSESGLSVGIKEQFPDGSWNFNDTDRTRVAYFG